MIATAPGLEQPRGGLDVLINNAGSLVARRTLGEADDPFWAEVMALNLDSTRRVTRSAAPHLIAAAKTGGGASIVNLSSLAGRKGGHPGSLVYSTAKGAILTFTRALANELGPQGVRVNALAPGMILGTSFHNTHTTPESAKATVAGGTRYSPCPSQGLSILSHLRVEDNGILIVAVAPDAKKPGYWRSRIRAR